MQDGLVVEDLAASAQWLARVLGEAFPGIRARVAETLEDARHAARAEEIADGAAPFAAWDRRVAPDRGASLSFG